MRFARTILALALGLAGLDALASPDDLVSDQLVLELIPGGPTEQEILQRYNLTKLDDIPEWLMVAAQVVPGTDTYQVCNEMVFDGMVDECEPHYYLESPEGVQRSIGIIDLGASATTYQQQAAASIVHGPAAHTRYTGADVVVAVIDTSQSFVHPETGAVIARPGVDFAYGSGTAERQSDGVDNDGDGLVDESLEHGTHVAGLVHLAAPDARILPIRILEEDGKGTAFAVAKGIGYALSQGADVINLSFGLLTRSKAVEEAINRAYYAGVPIVAAAGNRAGEGLDYPATDSHVIAVAAVDDTLVKADFTSFGGEIDVSAPGVDTLSTWGLQEWGRWSGTSFAAPLVSGGVALLLEKYPGLTPSDVRSLLRSTAQPDNNPEWLDGLMGDGVLDLQALAAVLTTDRTSTRVRREVDASPTWHVSWSPVKGAARYDVARGDLANLSRDDVSVDLGQLSCLGNDTTATSLQDQAVPAPGHGVFYVIRDDAPDAGGRSYGTDGQGRQRLARGSDCQRN